MANIGDIDRRYLWHPFTQMADWEQAPPLVITHGDGCELFDEAGNAYLDGSSSIWVNIHGHRKPAIDQALKDQIDRISHSTFLGLTNPPAALLAERLVQLAPEGLSRVFYSDNGSTAVEIALKMAFQYQRQRPDGAKPQKRSFAHLKHAYHGDTVGAVSLGGIALFHGIFGDLLFATETVEFPYCYRCPYDKTFPDCALHCVEPVARLLEEKGDELAAFIVEPMVQGASGVLTMPDGYLSAIADLCKRHDVLLIADEVATGFGRTGTLFACEHEQIKPDFLCTSKGLTGGYMPLAATLTTEVVYEAFLGHYDEFKTFFHGHSYTGNPLGCAAAMANLDVFEDEAVLATTQPKIRHLWNVLQTELADHPNVGEIRGRGLMVGIELVADRELRTPFPLEAQLGNRIGKKIRERGILIRPVGSVIMLMPPLAMTEAQLTRLVKGVRWAMDEVLKEEAAS
jgi:adenosylmethionine-8-amino-7-oxononanoate aminotransferase